ncbi:hypothetical protein Glove_335g47 [Diversispora epigaea]|uniref:Uncharacterized protein n=1 Tax=Diversispora epigaea TaxID=1348612 RepID=A0A397HI58_9GLOM|nr:hypothetical protein Glove_335g47 [Diversispora epigaea]
MALKEHQLALREKEAKIFMALKEHQLALREKEAKICEIELNNLIKEKELNNN